MIFINKRKNKIYLLTRRNEMTLLLTSLRAVREIAVTLVKEKIIIVIVMLQLYDVSKFTSVTIKGRTKIYLLTSLHAR